MNCDPMDEHNHGSHVAGTIGAAGNNGIGVAGVAWNAQLMALKFVDASGSGTVADAIRAIQFAVEVRNTLGAAADIRVLSNSWGGTEFSQALLDEIMVANDHDMLFVAAAGNNGLPNEVVPTYPASFAAPNIISVAATTNTDSRAVLLELRLDHGAPRGARHGHPLHRQERGLRLLERNLDGDAPCVWRRCARALAVPAEHGRLERGPLGSVDLVAALTTSTITGGRLNVHNALHACIAPPGDPG